VARSEAEVLVWAEPAKAQELETLLQTEAKGVRWVQLPYAGIEPYVDVIARNSNGRVWTCAKGVYAEPVAEHALMLLLAGLRRLDRYGRAGSWSEPLGTNLLGGKVVIVGGGGITESLLRLLEPFAADVTVVRRHAAGAQMQGASRVVAVSELDQALDRALGVVVALALTPETHGIIGRDQLARISELGWIVNVARGRHIVTDDLVAALRDRVIGGAALDVTDPEPLPDDHPLWSLPNCIITPHVGNTPEMALPLLATRIAENLRRWANDDPLLGLVDPGLGY
jgi:phosphoglycerate dehydrogenase-like enzyme